jgi:hypothetical protein
MGSWLELESGRERVKRRTMRTCSTAHQGLLRPLRVDCWSYRAALRGRRVIVNQRNHAIILLD